MLGLACERLPKLDRPHRENTNCRHGSIDMLSIALRIPIGEADQPITMDTFGETKDGRSELLLSLSSSIHTHDIRSNWFTRTGSEQFRAGFATRDTPDGQGSPVSEGRTGPGIENHAASTSRPQAGQQITSPTSPRQAMAKRQDDPRAIESSPRLATSELIGHADR